MKKYVIRVNGKSYDVEVEEVKYGAPVTKSTAISSDHLPKVIPKPNISQRPKTTLADGLLPNSDNRIVAPMAGTIVKVIVKPGDSVDTGDVLLVLEAMKMENDIIASIPGKVDAVHVTTGSVVNAGDILITLA